MPYLQPSFSSDFQQRPARNVLLKVLHALALHVPARATPPAAPGPAELYPEFLKFSTGAELRLLASRLERSAPRQAAALRRLSGQD